MHLCKPIRTMWTICPSLQRLQQLERGHQRAQGSSKAISSHVKMSTLCSLGLKYRVTKLQILHKKKEKLWLRILERYNFRRGAHPERSWKSLQSRWDTIKADMGKFASYYVKVLRENRSGMSDVDKTSQAAANFCDIEGRQFCYLHCWDIMKDEPKWQDAKSRANLKSAAAKGFGEDNMNLGDGNSGPIRAAEKRPMGRDKAKA